MTKPVRIYFLSLTCMQILRTFSPFRILQLVAAKLLAWGAIFKLRTPNPKLKGFRLVPAKLYPCVLGSSLRDPRELHWLVHRLD